MAEKKVLTICSQAGGANALLPVIGKIGPKIKVYSICDGPAKGIFADHSIPYFTLGDQDLSRLLEDEAPCLLLLGQACPAQGELALEQKATLVAKEMNIPILSLSDFWTNGTQYFSDTSGVLSQDLLPDTITVIDNTQLEIMIEDGFPPEKLVVTGNPHFDSLDLKSAQFTGEDRHEIRARNGVHEERFIFYAAHVQKKYEKMYGFCDLHVLNVLDEGLREIDYEVATVVKMHPAASIEEQELITKYVEGMRNTRIASADSAQDLALASDLVVTAFSTVGIEALLMGRPVVSLQPGLSGENFYRFVTERGLVPVGFTHDECTDLLRYVVDDDAYRHLLAENAKSFKTHGGATERVVSLIYEQIKD